MSRTDDLAYLEAQRAAVQAQLEHLRPEQRLMRLNLESRLRMIDEEIAALEVEEAIDQRAKVVLTFGGKPVVEEAGAIEATFGAEALQAWQRLVSTAAATREGRRLNARGPVPDAENYRLFITGTSPGSFSFELEDVASVAQPDPGVLQGAVDQASLLLQATQLDDDLYADAIAEADPRVVKALKDFLGLIESREATLRLWVEERVCLFDTPDKVARAAERTRKTNIREAEEPIPGVLSGVFAMGRRFEFKREDDGEVISGRITRDIEDPASLKPHLLTRCLAHLWIVTVERAGQKQRTYYLRNVEPLADG
ncbi:hypothetical protein WME99_15615 [Sorangium sp. So ce136]|uniref:hypothetical protein n=1 Tax=Sorangium sp. So ce136 TaxID=3133284 RepID=UPI003F122A3D